MEFVIKTVNWNEYQKPLENLRRTVFIDEQNVPKDMEWDGKDLTCTHFLVNIANVSVACARLTKEAQIGRMAVLNEFRNQGVGTALLKHILKYCVDNSVDHPFLHAQTKAIPFYERHGFICVGDVFMDAGIEHKTMTYNKATQI